MNWDDDTQTVTAVQDDVIIIMQIDNDVISVSGNDIILDVAPQLIDSRTLVPVRAVAEGLDAKVDWDNDTQTVIITKADDVVDTSSKPARYPEYGILYGYGDDGIAELQYNARYLFEQQILPQNIFGYEKETIDYINSSNINKMEENILSIWELAAANVIINDAELSGENLNLDNEDELWTLVDERRPIYGLDDKHIVDVTLEKVDSNTNAIIVELLDTKWTMLSKYIGIAYNKTVGLKCFTLEKSLDIVGDGNAQYMFCHVEGDSRGSYYTVKDNKQAFVTAIKDVMNSPTANLDEPNPEESVILDGVKCTLNATITVMDFGSDGKVALDEGTPTMAGISVFNDKGENITSKLYFGKIKITKGSEVKNGNIDIKDDSTDHAYKFFSDWNPGEYADVTVEVKDSSGKFSEISAKNVKIFNMTESLENLLGPDFKVEIN